MTTHQDRRTFVWLEYAVLCLSLLYLGLHVLPKAWRTLNTDFPNYYMASRLVDEGYDTSRMYEWQWIEREKDHRALDIRVIGLLPITPFSTLAVWPLAKLEPLSAKHIWILLNLALLIPLSLMLKSMTGLSYHRILLAFTLSFPFYRNLLFGQFYILLLLLIVAGCWSYLGGNRVLAGVLVAIAAACKVFPILLFVFFLQRRDWRALVAGVITGVAAVAASVAVFGWTVHRTWLSEILPWVMHGEGLQPYTVTASISGILHRLFLSEPQWNPHPWHDSPLAYALLFPTLQILLLAPAILSICRRDRSQQRILLEWSGLITAALAISTLPASYNFVLMVLPVCVVGATLIQQGRFVWLTALIVAYLGIGCPIASPQSVSGLAVFLYVPRLPLLLAFLTGIYALLWRDRLDHDLSVDWLQRLWIAAMLTSTILSVRNTLHLERAERQEYAYRLDLQNEGFINSNPHAIGEEVRYIAFTLRGYNVVTENSEKGLATWPSDNSVDTLSFASSPDLMFVEQASEPRSDILDVRNFSRVVTNDARDPMVSLDGKTFAFIRDYRGRGRLFSQTGFEPNTSSEIALTPQWMNVYEAAFVSARSYVVSAAENGQYPGLYLTDGEHANLPLSLGASRYPALSPDGRWLAYSHLDHGLWNLWLRDQRSGVIRRIADIPCNQIQPAWESDSKTLLYATDCGRSVWFTAVARRKIIP